MQTDVRQVFYFHADANSLGGFLGGKASGLEDLVEIIPTHSSVSLSPTGGSATTRSEAPCPTGGVEVHTSMTHVYGVPKRPNGPWTQRVISTVTGFELLGRIKAKRLVAQIFIEQPEGGGPRKISFGGSKIEDLSVDGHPVALNFNPTLLPQHHRDIAADTAPVAFTPDLPWTAVESETYRQGVARLSQATVPKWAEERFAWMAKRPDEAQTNPKGYELCSLVDQIDGVTTGTTFAHTIEIPDFGRIFLAEVIVSPLAASLTMFRAELGCAVTGQVSASTVRSNGTTCPPN